MDAKLVIFLQPSRGIAIAQERRAIEIASRNEKLERIKSLLGLTDDQLEKIKELGIDECAFLNLIIALQPMPCVSELAEQLEQFAVYQELPEEPEYQDQIFTADRQCGRTALLKSREHMQAKTALYKRPKIPPGNKNFR